MTRNRTRHPASRSPLSGGDAAAPASTGTPSAIELRAQRKAAFATRLRLALVDAGASLAVAAADLGVSKAWVGRATDPDDDGVHLGAYDVSALPVAVRRPIVETLAESLGTALADLPDGDREIGDDLALVARMQRETSEAVSKMLDACVDSHVTAAEARGVISEIDEAIAALTTAKARLQEAVDGHVTPIRKRAAG